MTHLVLDVQGGSGPVEVRLTAEPLDDGTHEVRELEARVGVEATEVGWALDSTVDWRISASAPGLWAPELRLPAGADGPQRMTLWPAATVEARLRLPEETDTVAELRLRLGQVAAAPSAHQGGLQPGGDHEVACTVRDRGIMACPVPAGRWNVRAAAEGFAPYFLWDVAFPRGGRGRLGELTLQRGGTVVGQVVTEEGPADPASTKVDLLQMVELPATAPAEEEKELEQLAFSAQIDPRGHFQLGGVPPGSYRLSAAQPGFAPAVQAPVVVEREGWTQIEEPLVLERLLELTVSVQPVSNPLGEPWTLQLLRGKRSQLLEEVASATTDATGFWRSAPLPGGPYVLRVLDGQENWLAWEAVELRRDSAELQIELDMVYVEGRVVIGDEPVQGSLWFGGRSGTERVKTESDEEGEFLVVLPRPGEWRVDVSSESPPVLAQAVTVEVEPLSGLSTAELRIELPDTSVSGEVVDEVGVPVPSPSIYLISMSEARGVIGTDGDPFGRFQIRGIREGVYLVEAETAEGKSDPLTASVVEKVDSGMRLVLRGLRPMAGRVLSAFGPVPRAFVRAYPYTASGQMAAILTASTHTDMEGRFELRVPASTRTLQLMVFAPGHPFALLRVSEGEVLEVVLGREQGTLRLEGLGDPRESGTVGVVMIQGEAIDVPALQRWAMMNGERGSEPGTLVVPAMPAGAYALCRLSLEEGLIVTAGAALPKPESCAEGYLPPGGELRLTAGG